MSSDRVDLRHWRTFLAVVDQGSFTRAGEALHVTQPAVSLLVKRLEKHCGLPVLDRSGKRVIVTPVGQALAEQARRLLAVAGETEDVVRDLQGLRAGQVTVAASTLPGTYLLPPALAAFGAEWPKVSVRVALDDTRVAQQRVLRNEVDFGVMGQTQHPPGLTAVPYATDELVLVVARTHRLAQRRQVGVRDLAGLGFVG
ncbi:MAG: LysR family transcriptional regulator, partial [Armatimonadetes bacterium]|nr:LysR family transcriptional regulator [Armatimonadota bacterium]